MQLKKVLHVDDHEVAALGLEQLVKRLVPDADFRAVRTISAAFSLLETWQPDVIFLDLHLENESAMEHIAAIQKKAAQAPIAIFSAIDDVSTMLLTQKKGAAGYIRKGAVDSLLASIEQFFANGYYIPPELASAQRRRVPSDRKLAVLKLLVAGKPNKVIAKELKVSPDTVKTHVQQLFQMLGVKNRTQAADVAKKQGLV